MEDRACWSPPLGIRLARNREEGHPEMEEGDKLLVKDDGLRVLGKNDLDVREKQRFARSEQSVEKFSRAPIATGVTSGRLSRVGSRGMDVLRGDKA